MTILYLNQVMLILTLIILWPVIGAGLIDKAGITVTSSSNLMSQIPDLAVDGDARRNPNTCNCCAATRNDYEPWYKVDLGQVYNIQFVDVIGRGGDGDSSAAGLHIQNMKVTYGINTYDETEMFANSAAVYVVYHNLSTAVPGRFMEIKVVGTSRKFYICELFVYSECDDGRYGRDCVTCGACLDGAPCNKADGTCTSCAAGYNGTKCDQECPPGEYGPDCTERCGHCKNGTACDRTDGSCIGSCIECQQGYMPPLCKDCSGGFHGENCSLTCGNCEEGSTCDSLTGVCQQGCANGYNGTHCDTECNHGHYGANCLEQCGFCKGNVTCNRFDGSCVECAEGYAGVMCKQKLPECNCNAEKGQLLAAAIGGTVGAILFLEAVIAIFILLWKKRSKDKHHDHDAAADTTTTTKGFYEMPDQKATQ